MRAGRASGRAPRGWGAAHPLPGERRQRDSVPQRRPVEDEPAARRWGDVRGRAHGAFAGRGCEATRHLAKLVTAPPSPAPRACPSRATPARLCPWRPPVKRDSTSPSVGAAGARGGPVLGFDVDSDAASTGSLGVILMDGRRPEPRGGKSRAPRGRRRAPEPAAGLGGALVWRRSASGPYFNPSAVPGPRKLVFFTAVRTTRPCLLSE